MSKTIDQKVVEMQFDNSNFEKNVKTSLTTLEKLKQSVKLDGVAKGFEDLDKAANSISLDGIASGIEVLERRFSTFGIVGMRVIERMTDSVLNLSHRMTSFVTNGITQGGIRRAMNIENAHFQLQGLLKDEEAVQAIMDDAMQSVDATAYAYDSAAKAAAQFAASGMRSGAKMQSALRAITGVAAMTNSEYEDISRIFTTVSGNGRVMGEQLLQLSSRGLNAAATLAEYLGKTESEVREMVSDGEISFDTFATAMDNAFGAHAKKANETFTGAMSNIRAALAKIGADFVSPLLVQNGPLVKLLNTVRLRINDARKALTPLAESFAKVATKAINALTDFLEKLNVSAVFEKFSNGMIKLNNIFSNFFDGFKENSKWNEFTERLKSAGISIDDFQTKLKETAKTSGIAIDSIIKEHGSLANAFKQGAISSDLIIKTLKKYADEANNSVKNTTDLTQKLNTFQKVVDDVWYGKYKNAPERYQLLAEAGYDYVKVQELVNKTVDGHRLTLEDLSDVQLINIGYTNEEIKKIRELAAEAEKSGTPLNELIEGLSKPSNGNLLVETFKNALGSIRKIVSSAKGAWSEIFVDHESSGLLTTFVETLHEISTHLIITDEGADKLKRTFKGLFAAIDLVSTITNTGLKFGLQVVQEVFKALGLLDVDILSITATIGDAIVSFREWAKEHGVITKALNVMAPALGELLAKIIQLVKKIYEIPAVQGAIEKFFTLLSEFFTVTVEYFSGGIDKISEFIDHLQKLDGISFKNVKLALKDFKETVLDYFFDFDTLFNNIGDNIIGGLVNGLQDGASKVVDAIVDIAKGLLKGIMDFLGIHSPSRKFMEIGEHIISGLVLGIRNGASGITNAMFETGRSLVGGFVDGVKAMLSTVFDAGSEIGNTIFSAIGQIDFDKLFVAGSLVGVLVIFNKFANAFDKLVSPLEAFNGIFESVSGFFNSLSESISNFEKAKSLETKSKALFNLAKAIGVLTIALVVLARMDGDSLMKGLAIVTGLSVGLAAMLKVTDKIDNNADFSKISRLMLGLSASLLVLSIVVKKLSGIEPGKAWMAITEMGAIIGGLTLLVAAYGKLVKGDSAANADKMGKMLTKLSISIGILAIVIKMIASMSTGDIAKGIITMTLLGTLAGAMVVISKFSGDNADKAGKMVQKMAIAMGIMVVVMKSIAKMEVADIAKSVITVTLIGGLFAAFVAVSKYAGEHGSKAGSMLFKMSAAMLILIGVIKLVSSISAGDIAKGLLFIGSVEILFGALMMVSKYAGEHGSKAGSMLLKMSAAMIILVGVVALVSSMDPEDVNKGLAFVAKVEILFGALIAVSKFAGENADKAGSMLLKMTAPIAMLAFAIAVLSYLDTEKVMKASEALSLVIGAFAILVAATSQAKKASGTLILLTTIVAALGGILYLLQGLPVDSTLGVAGSLSMMLLALSAAVTILGNAKKVGANAMGSMVLLTPIMAALALILKMLQGMPVASTLSTATSLSILLLSLTAAIRILGEAKNVSMSAIGSVALLTVVVGALGLILYALKDLPVESTLTNAAALSELLLALTAVTVILGKLGHGSLTGAVEGAAALDAVIAIIGGLMVAMGGLVTLIPDLEVFLNKGIDILNQIGSGIGSFVGSIVGGFVDGMSENLVGIADSLVEFMNHLGPFLEDVKGIDESSMNGVRSLCEAILALTAADFVKSVTEFFTGGTDFTEFGNELVEFGKALATFSNEVKGKIDESAITAAANAGNIMAKLENSLPKKNGWLQDIAGEKDLKTFGKSLESFGKSMSSFSRSVSGENSIDEGAIQSIVNAGKIMVQLQDLLPKTNGVWDSIKEFFSGGGNGSLSDFGEDLGAFGAGISAFYTQIQNVDGGKIGNISIGLSHLTNMLKGMEDLDDSGAKSFASAITELAKADVSGFLATFGASAEKMKQVGITMAEAISIGLKSKKTLLNTAALELLNSMLKTFESTKSKFNNAGGTMMKAFGVGISSKTYSVNKNLNALLNQCIAVIKAHYSGFYSAGSYAASGLAKGIADSKPAATNAVIGMTTALLTAARNSLIIRSPSKKMYEVGAFAGQGFVNALLDFASIVYNTGKSVGRSALDGVSNAISKAQYMLDGNIDLQPTIRPVLDLSNVSNGVGTINRMLDISPSMEILSNVGSISRMMKGNQNDTNAEVVSAINKLRGDLGNMEKPTYNINGVTYGDGSEVSDAIKVLVRAAKVERRS